MVTEDSIRCHKEATERRGQFMAKSVILERAIDFYVANYFCKERNKRDELLDLIIATKRMIWENKVQVFKVLVERYEKTFLKENPTIFTDITNIIEHRNILAHYSLYSSGGALEEFVKTGTLTFVKFINTRKFLEFSKETLDKMEIMTSDYGTKVIALVNSKASPSKDATERSDSNHSNKEETI